MWGRVVGGGGVVNERVVECEGGGGRGSEREAQQHQSRRDRCALGLGGGVTLNGS